jgi:hypothetical protein
MSLIAKLAWPIQIAIFVLLLIFLPHGTMRLVLIFGYILLSVPIVSYLRRRYG